MILYPLTNEFLPDEDYETLMYNNSEDYLPYDPSMDAAADIYDLEEGEMICWPLNRPHRVDNMSYCVSVTTEYSTPESTLKNATMYTNAVLRRKFGMNPKWEDSSAPEIYLKAGIGKVLRKLGVLETLKEADMVSFTVDKSEPNYIKDIDPLSFEHSKVH